MAEDLAIGNETIEDEIEVDSNEVDDNTEEVQDSTRENEEEESDKEEKESEEEQEEEEEGPKLDASPTWKQLNTKYPQLFKDFPGLKHTFFHAQEYRKVFGSVEDAQEAAEQVENFKQLGDQFTSGRVEDLTSAIKTFDNEVIESFGTNFLPALKAASPEAYYEAITPELSNFCRTLYDYGARNNNDNMKNAALVAAAHFFGDSKVASGESKVQAKEPKKDTKLDEERTQFRTERYNTLLRDVTEHCDTTIDNLIKTGLDPKNSMSESMARMLTKEIRNEINKVLNSDRSHVSKMNSLWKKASVEGFSSVHKSNISKAYLERAKEIMPSIRSKIRSAALGIRTRKKSEGDSDNTNGRREPQNTTGGGSNKGGQSTNDARKIDWSKTSDLDFINDRVTLKK